jgi:hypothetical protein
MIIRILSISRAETGVCGRLRCPHTPHPQYIEMLRSSGKNGLIILEYGMMGPAQTGCEFNHTNE